MLRRELFNSPVWQDVEQFLLDRIEGLTNTLIDGDDPEVRGAIKELRSFVAEYPDTLPDEMPTGPADPVNEALDDKGRS